MLRGAGFGGEIEEEGGLGEDQPRVRGASLGGALLQGHELGADLQGLCERLRLLALDDQTPPRPGGASYSMRFSWEICGRPCYTMLLR